MRNFMKELSDFLDEHVCVEGQYQTCYYETLADGDTIYDKIDELWGSDTEGYSSDYETCPDGEHRVVYIEWFDGISHNAFIFFVCKGTVEDLEEE